MFPLSTPLPLKTTCTSRKREITRGGNSCSFAIFGGRPYNETAREVCEHEKSVDDRRFGAAGAFCFWLCKCRIFRGDAIFGGNGHGRACAEHCAAGAHNRFCFGKYRDSRREHRRIRDSGNTAGGFNTCRRQSTAADREQHHRVCAAESIRAATGSPCRSADAGNRTACRRRACRAGVRHSDLDRLRQSLCRKRGTAAGKHCDRLLGYTY